MAIIPPTAREYRLPKNWWYDGRRDILNSTKAATHFLSDMHRHFKKDWLLAIASYNTGAGKVGKSMSKAKYVIGKTSFWDLSLPRETEIYVPKLLALRDIMANPKITVLHYRNCRINRKQGLLKFITQ